MCYAKAGVCGNPLEACLYVCFYVFNFPFKFLILGRDEGICGRFARSGGISDQFSYHWSDTCANSVALKRIGNYVKK